MRGGLGSSSIIWYDQTLGHALGMTLKLYTGVAKELKLKVRTFCGLSPTFVEVIGEKLVGRGLFAPLPTPS